MKAVVLVSGGLDSSVLLHYVHQRLGYNEIRALSFVYGQMHSRELEMARWQCAAAVEAVVEHRELDISFLGALTAGASALTDPGIALPDLDQIAEEDRDQPLTYVPNRNMVFLSIAASYAESRGCDALFYGAQAQDEYGYWDCTVAFVDRLNRVLGLNRRVPVRIEAPFQRMRKSEELKIGLELGVDFSHTWSCYRGEDTACGTCPTCVERLKAFAEVGVRDPLDYCR